MTFRSFLYRTARTVGDAQAAARGPAAYSRRRVRRTVYRRVNGGVWRTIRKIGLG